MDQLDASSDCSAAIARLADADTHIVSLTVTEAGYCLNGEALDVHHPDVVHDLADPAQPRSAPGLLVAALAQRRANGLPPFTAMSCDNLVKNGERLRSAVLAFARLVDPALAQWIESRGCFPCSMVDRITPAMDVARRERLCEDWGVDDRVPVICEPWQQWIIEDHFVCGRPAFERVGVVFSDDVTRYEEHEGRPAQRRPQRNLAPGPAARLRERARGPGRSRDSRLARRHMREVSATLSPLPDVDYAEYERALTRRFSNAAIQDRLLRLAMDSSTKFPQVLLPPVLRRLDAGLSVDFLATAIALWLVYLDVSAATTRPAPPMSITMLPV